MHRVFFLGVVVCLSICLSISAHAQADPLSPAEKKGLPDQSGWDRERPELPGFQDEKPAPIPAPSPPAVVAPRISESPAIFVSRLIFKGHTVFSTEELLTIAHPYLNRNISSEELQALRFMITRHYIDNGYINSGAVIPDQPVVDGQIVIQIIEGRLTHIEVSGNNRLRTAYIEKRLRLGMDGPLNIHQLQERVRMLDAIPLIERINAALGPGSGLGEAVLKARIVEASPFTAGIEVNNHRSPRIGAEGAELYASHRNLSGWGDALGIRIGQTEGLTEVLGFYELPVTARDTTLLIRYEQIRSEVTESPFDIIDIEGDSRTFGAEIRHPVFHTPSQEVALGLRWEVRKSETSLLGRPFSFTPGVEDGKSRVTALRFVQEWFLRKPSQVLAFRSVISAGIDAFGATTHPDLPDGRFFAWLGQFQWAQRLPFGQALFRTDMQFCDESVLPMEKFSVGGAQSVRGYRTNELVRDNAVVASLELRFPLFRLPLPAISKTPEDGTLQLALFTDWGWSENKDDLNVGPRTIGSAGPGLRWDPSEHLHAQLYWGIAFRDMDETEYNLQDSGIHFQFNWRIF